MIAGWIIWVDCQPQNIIIMEEVIMQYLIKHPDFPRCNIRSIYNFANILQTQR